MTQTLERLRDQYHQDRRTCTAYGHLRAQSIAAEIALRLSLGERAPTLQPASWWRNAHRRQRQLARLRA